MATLLYNIRWCLGRQSRGGLFMTIKKLICTNIRNQIIAYCFLVLLGLKVYALALPNILNLILPPQNLNTSTINLMYKPKDLKLQPILNSDVSFENMVATNKIMFNRLYRYNLRYRFRLQPLEIYDTGVIKTEYIYKKIGGREVKLTDDLTTQAYLLLEFEEGLLITNVNPHSDFNKKTYTGTLTPLTPKLKSEILSRYGGHLKSRDLSYLVFDTQSNYLFIELRSLAYFICYTALLYVLGRNLLTYIRNYRSHPAYRPLRIRYEEPKEVEMIIDTQLQDSANKLSHKKYVTSHFVIEKRIFRTKLMRFTRG